MKTEPKLTVIVNGEKHVFGMYWEADAVSVGSSMKLIPGLAMHDDAFNALEKLVGIDAEVPMYCYNEGGDVFGAFEDENEVPFGAWLIEI